MFTLMSQKIDQSFSVEGVVKNIYNDVTIIEPKNSKKNYKRKQTDSNKENFMTKFHINTSELECEKIPVWTIDSFHTGIFSNT